MLRQQILNVSYRTIQHICCLYLLGVQFIRRDQVRSHAMEFIYFINLIFIFVVNILFFFSGICLNSLVIVSFWRSVQLRKKLYYFTVMVLSCCDLLAVLTNHPMTALLTMLWFTEKVTEYPGWLLIPHALSDMSISFSILALFVIHFDQYLATHYPIFHRASVTKGKLSILFTFLAIISIIVTGISISNLIISNHFALLIFCIIFIIPMLFINYKLHAVARKHRRNKGRAPEVKKSFSLKNISSCMLTVACLIALSIPSLVYIVLRLISTDKKHTLDSAELAALWAKSTSSVNSTLNCLIYYWKNKTLRTEGLKIIKSMKICRRHQSWSVRIEPADDIEM